MEFVEAIAYAISRGVVLPETYYTKLNNDQRKRTVSIAGLASLDQIRYVLDELNKSIASGSTFASFQQAVAQGDFDIALSPDRLDNIARTNAQAAYNHGRWQQQQQTKSLRPYLMYDAINDSRTRPSHGKLDNLIRSVDDPVWNIIYPPNGFRCRCVVRSLSEKQMLARGGETADVSFATADPGWAGGPANYSDSLVDLIYRHQSAVKGEGFVSLQQVKDEIVQAANEPKRPDSAVVRDWLGDQRTDDFKELFDTDDEVIRQTIISGLGFEEYAALKYYTGEGYVGVNRFLNGLELPDSTKLDVMVDAVVLLQQSLNKMPAYAGEVTRTAVLSAETLNRYQIGRTVAEPAFTSSTVADYVHNDKRNVVFVINSVKGRRIDSISSNPDELEVLFSSGAVFEVFDRKELAEYIEITINEVENAKRS